ncbi:MAG TPA: 4-hydroxy-tetrahydrodipicolinate reductase [Chitinophagales bacterium]|nr:4-hydroxy-tetrahydrodipicolinate reductase [Chitinophagales bacterium]
MKIALLGYGKMGKMIEEIIQREGKHEVNLKVTSANRSNITSSLLKNSDVAIDFSSPNAVEKNITLCLDAVVPLVIGTTGWYDDLEKVKSLCEEKNGALIYASNFSIGVNIFFELNKKLAELMKHRNEYEPRITEIHHAQKKDSPSGTAISLARDILQSSAIKKQWVNHEKAMSDEVVILSRREGTIVGTHRIEYRSAVDRIEITHEAFSREGFAQGAITAAEWIRDKKGFYEFREIILNDTRFT